MVSGALVSGTWSDGTAGSCSTDNSGQCSITLSDINRNTGSVTFTVEDVSASGYEYEPNGSITTIEITKP